MSEYDRLSLARSGGGGICNEPFARCTGGSEGGMLCILVSEPRRWLDIESHSLAELTREVWDG